uniref:Uncharacterized protein n=1 Tax=Aegilops tauschii subsp. strangulata TaxID=200361 RepID=A0A453EJ42_AEGTS
MDADDVGLALHPHGGILAAASRPAAYPKAGAGAGGIVAPGSSVHELLECPVCTNSMYPPIHQVLDFAHPLLDSGAAYCVSGVLGLGLLRDRGRFLGSNGDLGLGNR